MSAAHPYRRSQHGESSTSTSQAQHDPSAQDVHDLLRPTASTKESKRLRGEIACAECRRLKIKCDRKVPCTTCMKRGCAALCPNSTIPPGDGSRFVLAATEHLRQKMAAMEARMHALEDALAIAQSGESNQPHPLLTVPFEDEVEDEPSLLQPMNSEETTQASNQFGMLHMDPVDYGSARFFGPSGGSESLLIKAKELEALQQPRPVLQELDPSYLPDEINQLCQGFPFTPPGMQTQVVIDMIETFLPPIERAIELTDTFLEHLSWMFHIVSRQLVVGELIPTIYKLNHNTYGPHDLALMLITLGIGALVDLNLPPYNLEAQHYYRLACAALGLQPVLAQQSVVTIKTLHLISIYNGMSGKESNLEQSYMMLSLAGRLALGIGFHVDPSSWGFQGREAYDRRVYFWNLLAAILWQALVTGRPPVILQTFIHCQMPTDEEEELYQLGEVPHGFGTWGFKASVECLLPAVRVTLAAKPPPYSEILELDRKIRSFASVASASDDQNDNTALSMRTFVRSHYQDLILLFLHRGFFAQAMAENTDNPLRTAYGESVTAAYQSACVVLEDTRVQFMKKPTLCARVWRIWSLAFSAAIVIGAVAIRRLDFQPLPLEQFEIACLLFQKAAETSSRAARALPILFKMRQKAHTRYGTEDAKMSADEELAIFSGRVCAPSASHSTPTAGPSSSPPVSTHQSLQFHYHPLMGEVPQPSSNFPTSSASSETIQPPLNPLDGWNSLYTEIPGPAIPTNVDAPPSNVMNAPSGSPGAGATFDVRWSSFMNT
ncbi:Zn(2)-C6 fungal-type domain-containing protein [Pleurotus pulmonarius]